MMNNFLSFIAAAEDESSRLDKFIYKRIEDGGITVSRTMIQKLIESEMITVNGINRSKSYSINSGDFVAVTLPEPEEYTVSGEDIPLDIVYEDSELLVVNKQKGMVVHPSLGHEKGTLVNGILYHCGEELTGIGGVLRPGIVHRIDKDTSGLLVVAKNENSYVSLSKQLYNHTMKREYQAVCHGTFKEEGGTIDKIIGRDPTNRKRFTVSETGKEAITDYTVIKNFREFAYISLKLHTGRTHQIRVHMTSIGHPLAGDTLYGPKSTPKELEGQCLHAKVLGFIHPLTKDWIEFDSNLPTYFTKFLKTISGEVYE